MIKTPRPIPIVPRIYTASPSFRRRMWKVLEEKLDKTANAPVAILTSTWVNNEALDENDTVMCRNGWKRDILEIRESDYLLVYAEQGDMPSGTFVEVGAAFALHLPVVLAGSFDWPSWRHHPLVIYIHQNSDLLTCVKKIIDYHEERRKKHA